MGHHSASCALSGLPIYCSNDAIVVSLTGKIDTYDYWGNTYSLLQALGELVKQRVSNKEMQDVYDHFLSDAVDEDRKLKLEEVRSVFRREVPTPITIFRGTYSGYGDLGDLGECEMSREKPYMFFHPEVWNFCQEHWKPKCTQRPQFPQYKPFLKLARQEAEKHFFTNENQLKLGALKRQLITKVQYCEWSEVIKLAQEALELSLKS